ncbi:hypothetical protein [Gracilimonas tropica]|uniref:hypothetical protein n=1 Tax=Gracilimonas tropica TaxID=454600 RepID=UPI0012FA38AA|nr:hypothetical protein [Gracilimonas tropica]
MAVSTSSLAQIDKYRNQFVWSLDSAVVYAKPDMESKIKFKVRYGNQVRQLEVLDSLTTAPAFEIDDSFQGATPSARWIKVEYKSEKGYVKSDQLGVLPPFYRTDYGVESTEEYFKRIFRKIDEVEKKVPVNINGKIFEASVDSIQFGNGIYKTERWFDGCVDYEYKVVGLDFYQALNIAYMTSYTESMVNTGPPGKPDIKRHGYGIRLMSKEGNIYYFDGAFSAQEVYLKQIDETEYIFGHYYCV